MKISPLNRFLLLGLAALPFNAQATPLTWDITAGDGATITDGGDIWTTGADNWNSGAGDANWTAGDTATFTGTTGGTITVNAAGVSQAGMTFNGNSNYTVSGGSIGGAGSLTKNGTGILTLSSANGFTGGTTVSAGTLKLNAVSASGTGTITLNDAYTGTNDVKLDLSNFPIWANTFAPAVTVANQGSGVVTITLGAANFVSKSTFTLNRATTFAANNTGTTYASSSFGGGGLVTGPVGTLTLTENGTGTIAWGHAGANTYTGTTVLNKGSVTTYSSGAFGGSGNSLVMSSTGTLTMGSALAIGDLTGAASNTINNGGYDLTISSANHATFAGNITGTGGLTKSGGGTQKLSGVANSYSGTTTVSGGALLINGSKTGAGAVNVSTAILGGNGSIAGAVSSTVVGATFAPGADLLDVTTGTLSLTGTLNVANGANFNFGLGTASDLIAITGAFTGSTNAGDLNFNFADAGGLAVSTAYTLFTFASSTGLTEADLDALVIPNGWSLDPSFDGNGWKINGTSLQVQFIPEPAAALLGSLGLLTLLRRRRND